MPQNTISLIPIKDLLDLDYQQEPKYKFSVPSYQRGYKWGTDEVEYLLSDIWEFEENDNKLPDEIYCLQPIVVKNIDGFNELIDGQQRLTTIYLILSYLNIRCFELEYSTRSQSGNFLQTLCDSRVFTEKEKDSNVDYWHICNAWETIQKWMTRFERNDKDKERFKNCFLEKVKVIWYNIDESTETREIYSRLNVGKIPLTNAELVKALILSKDTNTSGQHKNKIAMMWDKIETSLHDDKLWCFLNNTEDASYNAETRIDYLLDLLTNKPEEKKKDEREKYYSFRKFQALLHPNPNAGDLATWHEQKIKTLNDAWSRIEDIFQMITDWYEDGKTYHYVGYYITFTLSPKGKHPVQQLYDVYKSSTKSEFISVIKQRIIEDLRFDNIDELIQLSREIRAIRNEKQSNQNDALLGKEARISEIVNNYLSQHNYDSSDKRAIRKILLLFNILTVMQNQRKLEEKNGKQTLQSLGNIFPFDLFKKEGTWDIEHVHSQTDKEIIKKEEQSEWLYNAYCDVEDKQPIIDCFEINSLNNLNDDEIRNNIRELIEKMTPEKFKENKQKVSEFIETGISKKDSLFNLTLLDYGTNRSYQNAFFPTKRKILLEKDKNGQFIPICTKNLFQKYYTSKTVKISSWNDNDAEGYKKSMINQFTNMITGKL